MERVALPTLPWPVRWLGVAGVAGAILWLSIFSTPPADPVVEPPSAVPLDKWRHALAYAALAGSLAYATADWDRPQWQVVAGVALATVAFGLFVEAWQGVIPGRYRSLGDAYANALGALVVVPWYAVRKRVESVPLGRLLD